MSAWSIEITTDRDGGAPYGIRLVVGDQRFMLEHESPTDGGAEVFAGWLRHAILAIERGVLTEALGTVKLMGCAVDDDHEYQSVRDEVLHVMRKAIEVRLPSCSGCAKPDGGTHSTGTREHP